MAWVFGSLRISDDKIPEFFLNDYNKESIYRGIEIMENITPHGSLITQKERESLNGHKALVLWFTGLSGSGKSSIAAEVERILVHEYGGHTAFLDGDTLRSGLNKGLGFSAEDRSENIRRAGEVAALMVASGLIVSAAFISPFAVDREAVRKRLPKECFWEVFVDCPLEVCQARDPKKLYQRANQGKITNFTGISSPYEVPLAPEVHLHSDQDDVQTCARQVISRLLEAGVIE